MITIQELLYNRGLDKNAKVKLVRHKAPSQCDLYDKYKNDREWFLKYQNSQGRDVFKGVDYIVSFLGEAGVMSRFIGVFKIKGVSERANPNPDSLIEAKYAYDMEEVAGFEDLKERVIVKWNVARAWHQWINDKMEVIEIHPGLNYKQFTNYSEFTLMFDELHEIVSNVYADWKKMLSVTKGIYLITDTSTGKLYVGSAYGEEGIWGRWKQYVATNGHGGNKMLKEQIAQDPTHGKHFQFSILMLLPSTITSDEAIKMEQLFKRKLGTNAFGLNNN